jgi:hypothetical protein
MSALNREGLSFEEWLAAAEQLERAQEPELFWAWEAGEDPTEWRAAAERSRS